ncbi:SemiSWEET transporter [Ramlibacter montanisoli]|uniref:SemiSWEET transporter n=1 Tax=Ramlibacter montanisoli TaxID=2732512 RepID=A0A849K970_9BURK|nr:SemiSWEET transporter [Ramlibacter montanisoli]
MDGAPTLRTKLPVTLHELVGYGAAILTTLSFVPQAWLTFRTRDVRGISLGMYSVFTVGVALWLLYGWMMGAWPIVIANAVTLALASVILTMKVRYG